MAVDLALLFSSTLVLLTVFVIAVYYKKMRIVTQRYAESEHVLDNIILSFKTDLERQGDKVRALSEKFEVLSLREEDPKKIEQYAAEVHRVRHELDQLHKRVAESSVAVDRLAQGLADSLSEQGRFAERLRRLEEHAQRSEAPILQGVEAAIPIRGERALARLTDTELLVLKLLVEQGDKTASQVKDKVKLTREHTSRLMKSLHARGYVERSTEKLPYTYRVKEEMVRILKESASLLG